MNDFKTSQSKLREIEAYLSTISAPDERYRELCDISLAIVRAISKNIEGYDRDTPFTRRNLWRYYDGTTVNEDYISKADTQHVWRQVGDLFVFFTRCYREKFIRTPHDTMRELNDRIRKYYEKYRSSNGDDNLEAEFLFDLMPRFMAADLVEMLGTKGKETEDRILRWSNTLAEFDQRLQKSESLVQKYQQEYNFVGLAHAFKGLIGEKSVQRNRQILVLILMGLVVLYPLASQVLGLKGEELFKITEGGLSAINYGKLISLVGSELLLLYFFRIQLLNYYSLKAQLLQLELRYAVCAFIESYADFAAQKKTQAGETLAKFESLVFSGIVPDLSNVPSTFDGIDQLAKLIREVRKP